MIFIWYMAMFGLRVKLRGYIMFSLGRNVDMVPPTFRLAKSECKDSCRSGGHPSVTAMKTWGQRCSKLNHWGKHGVPSFEMIRCQKKMDLAQSPRQASTSLDFISNLKKVLPGSAEASSPRHTWKPCTHRISARAHTQTSMCVCIYSFFSCTLVHMYVYYIYMIYVLSMHMEWIRLKLILKKQHLI